MHEKSLACGHMSGNKKFFCVFEMRDFVKAFGFFKILEKSQVF